METSAFNPWSPSRQSAVAAGPSMLPPGSQACARHTGRRARYRPWSAWRGRRGRAGAGGRLLAAALVRGTTRRRAAGVMRSSRSAADPAVYSLTRRSEVRFRGQTGKHLLTPRLTGFDPQRTLKAVVLTKQALPPRYHR